MAYPQWKFAPDEDGGMWEAHIFLGRSALHLMVSLEKGKWGYEVASPMGDTLAEKEGFAVRRAAMAAAIYSAIEVLHRAVKDCEELKKKLPSMAEHPQG